jgi:hypothetical protein
MVPRDSVSSTGRSMFPRPTVSFVGSHFDFYEGIEKEDQLDHIGVVHNVDGKGKNCGFHCLVLGLAVIDHNLQGRPKDYLEMRRELREYSTKAQKDLFSESISTVIFAGMDDEQRLEDWTYMTAHIYDSNVNYDDENFMTDVDEEGNYKNDHHWMEAEICVSIFAKRWRIRVALYGLAGNYTVIYDGLGVRLKIEYKSGFVLPETTCKRTMGLVFDGYHFRYLEMKRK